MHIAGSDRRFLEVVRSVWWCVLPRAWNLRPCCTLAALARPGPQVYYYIVTFRVLLYPGNYLHQRASLANTTHKRWMNEVKADLKKERTKSVLAV